jgi:hypothetical protein
MDKALKGSGRCNDEGMKANGIFLPWLFIFFYLLLCSTVSGQVYLRQTIRGTVIDKQSRGPLPGAAIILLNSDPVIGTVSDSLGRFRLEKVPVGKQQVRVSYMGFIPWQSEEITVTSGKETLLTVELQEMVYNSAEVEVRGDYHKYEAINKMATVSIRSFSVEETNRFAGSYGDPARMAANFAGVTSGIDNRNDIIVRGNTPMSLQYRIDGMEIPNPNHFAAVGTTGGPVTIINDNLLANSDFLTGAFPAQYGNTIAGIFDMRMRTGNPERHEYWGQIGWNGVEFGAEGPFSKNSQASFVIAYRYSLLQLISYTRIHLDVVPQYQDLNFNVNIPTKHAGTFSVTGIGGISYIELFDSRKGLGNWTFPEYGEDLSNGSNMGTLGVSNTYFFNRTLWMKNTLYVVGSRVYTKIDSFTILHLQPAPWAGENSSEVKYSFASNMVKKFSVKNTLNAGFMLDWYDMHFSDSVRVNGKFRLNTNSGGSMQFIRSFVQWQHKFTDFFSVTSGLYYQYLTLNGSMSVEPRFGFDWLFNAQHSIDFGTGLYSQMQPRVMYFVQAPLPDGTYIQTNRDLGFTRSAQVALGYNYLLNPDLRFRIEAYYEYLYDLPVKASIPEYSVINQGHEFFVDRQYSDSLVNRGTGTNYGVEVTFEKFFSKKYFFLLTASFFNSSYYAYDKVLRSTAFNGNYAMNATGGYEFRIGKRKLGLMSFGLRATWAGGDPYIPFDVEETTATRQTAMNWQQSFQPRYPDYKRLSLRFGIKRNRRDYSMEFLLDLQYRTNYTNIYLQRIDVITGEIYNFYNMGFFPMGTWRIQF